MSFDGETFDPALDANRLDKQLGRVWAVLDAALGWLTLRELAGFASAPEASVSARLRDLRKERFGGYEVESRRRGDAKRGLWEYRLRPEPEPEPEPELKQAELKQAELFA